MIQMMARENGESYKTDASVLRETITATVKALGEGKIRPEEMPIPPDTRQDHIRYAPGYSPSVPARNVISYPYTMASLARFLGETDKGGEAHQAFRTTFAALELISEGYMNESSIKGMEVLKIGEMVKVARKTKEEATKRADHRSQPNCTLCSYRSFSQLSLQR